METLLKPEAKDTWPQGCLTESEYQELLGLEYVLTWQYTDNLEADSARYKELSKRKWDSLYTS